MTLSAWTKKLVRALSELSGQRSPRHEHITAALALVGPPPASKPIADNAASEAAYRKERGWT